MRRLKLNRAISLFMLSLVIFTALPEGAEAASKKPTGLLSKFTSDAL